MRGSLLPVLLLLLPLAAAGTVPGENAPPWPVDAGPSRTVEVGEAVNFSAYAVDPDGDAMEYLWGFGDGTTATGRNATHRFTVPGEYWVLLIVNDTSGHTSADRAVISVVPPPNRPIAAFDAGTDIEVIADEEVSLSASVGDPDGDDISVRWDLGDGTVLEGTSAKHIYRTPGRYTVTAVAEDGHGHASYDSFTVDVMENRYPERFSLTVCGVAIAIISVVIAAMVVEEFRLIRKKIK